VVEFGCLVKQFFGVFFALDYTVTLIVPVNTMMIACVRATVLTA